LTAYPGSHDWHGSRLKILVTGSSGRIGSAIVKALRASHEVIGLDQRPHAATTHLGSVTDGALVKQLVERVDAIVHTASLHAPHLASNSEQAFRDINIGGTERLLHAALKHRVQSFVYTSTTSVYGAAMDDAARAVWVTESLAPQARDIYDETKLAAEALCAGAHRAGLACVSLRMSRCFPEPDELMAIYRLYRGVDVRDVVDAHVRALACRFATLEVFNVSAVSPFAPDDCVGLKQNAAEIITTYFPNAPAVFAERGWQLPTSIDRVYATDKARRELGFAAQYNFSSLLTQPGV
jgi:UDP-glucose 4-epimerase